MRQKDFQINHSTIDKSKYNIITIIYLYAIDIFIHHKLIY